MPHKSGKKSYPAEPGHPGKMPKRMPPEMEKHMKKGDKKK